MTNSSITNYSSAWLDIIATHDIIHIHYDNYWLRITTWPTHTTRTSTLIGEKGSLAVSVCPWIVWFDWLQSFTPVEVDICMWGKGWNVHCPNSFSFLIAMTRVEHLMVICGNVKYKT